jgi:micrococcal nuclease
LLSWLLCGLVPGLAQAGEGQIGVVIKVFDGDSFIVRLQTEERIEVRLADIDAPEKDQPYADAARAALRTLIYQKKIRVMTLRTDRYQRQIARVFLLTGGAEVGEQMLTGGHAWVYRPQVSNALLYTIERQARERQLGLWALPAEQRQEPWRWRHAHPRKAAGH